MSNKNAVRLSERLIERLRNQSESGMGYQVATVKTYGGKCYQNVLITGRNTVSGIYGYERLPFDVDDILDIEVTHLQKPEGYDPKKWLHIEKQNRPRLFEF